MARNGGPQNERAHGCAGSFAEPHAEIYQRLKAQLVQERPVGGFRRYVGCHGVVQRISPYSGERSDCGRAYEPVDQHWNALPAGGQRGAQNGAKFAPAQRGRNV